MRGPVMLDVEAAQATLDNLKAVLESAQAREAEALSALAQSRTAQRAWRERWIDTEDERHAAIAGEAEALEEVARLQKVIDGELCRIKCVANGIDCLDEASRKEIDAARESGIAAECARIVGLLEDLLSTAEDDDDNDPVVRGQRGALRIAIREIKRGEP